MKFKKFKNFDINSDSKILSKNWKDNGFLILENFISNSECKILKDRANNLVRKFDFSKNMTIFNTKDHSHSSDKYFLDSGDKIRFFF